MKQANDLSPAEEQIALLLIRGISNARQIAKLRDLSHNTVRTHLRGIYRKLGVHDSTAAAVKLLTGRVG